MPVGWEIEKVLKVYLVVSSKPVSGRRADAAARNGDFSLNAQVPVNVRPSSAVPFSNLRRRRHDLT